MASQLTRWLEKTTTVQLGRKVSGSIMILVVVVLVLMVLMGTVYLQVARNQRQAVGRRGDINAVATAVVEQIRTVLKQDITDDEGKFFNPVNDDNVNQGGADEAYDYPSTNPAVDFNVTLIDGTQSKAAGGENDDMWLASTIAENLDVDGDGGVDFFGWRHLTNLTGVFVEWDQSADDGLGDFSYHNGMPREHVVDFSSEKNTDTDIAADSNLLVDADGDGIPDSRLAWAPIPLVNGVAYFMGVRIIDLSSLINVNAATALTNDGGIPDDPRGYFPTDIDLSRLLMRHALYEDSESQSFVLQEFSDFFHYRSVSATFPTPLGLTDISNFPHTNSSPLRSRVGIWLNSVSIYDGSQGRPWQQGKYGKYTFGDEIELRNKGGLNNYSFISNIEDIMPTLLRRDETENSWADIAATADEYFQGDGPATVADRTFTAVRHLLTTYNGAAQFAANHADIHEGRHVLKYDLNWQDYNWESDSYLSERIGNIAERLEMIFGITDTNSVNHAYLGLKYPDDGPELRRIAHEYAIAIQDYCDTDVQPSSWVSADGVTYYGLEPLPFIREVYRQIAFDDIDIIDANHDNIEMEGYMGPGPDGLFDTWRFAGNDTQGWAIEIGNPFDRPIDIHTGSGQTPSPDRIKLRLNIKMSGSDKHYNLDKNTFDFSTQSSGSYQSVSQDFITLPSRGRAIIYSNPTDQSYGGEDDDNGTTRGTDLLDLGFAHAYEVGYADVLIKARTDGLISGSVGAADSEDVIAMQVKVSGEDKWVSYDRFSLSQLDIPSSDVNHQGADPQGSPTARPTHTQGSVARDGQNLRYLSNQGMGVVHNSIRAPDDGGYRFEDQDGKKNDPQDGLNRNNKTGVTGDTSLDYFQLPLANRPFLSVAELAWLHMFGFTDEDQGDFPERFSGATGHTGLARNRRFLDVSQNAAIPTSTLIPHAVMVFDQFTTLNPQYDGKDNDPPQPPLETGAGDIDDELEQLVTGQMNINTIPTFLATLVAPLPESLDDIQTMMEMISFYRDFPVIRNAMSGGLLNTRSNPGIASIGELLLVNPHPAANTASDMKRYGNDGIDQSTTAFDLYPIPEQDSDHEHYNTTDNAEELMARFQFLSQVFTTRSDVFAAYIVIRGYDSTDFEDGPLESLRGIAIFNRARMGSPAGEDGAIGTDDDMRDWPELIDFVVLP